MVSHLFYYQLALLALVWLFVMLHVAESQRGAPIPPTATPIKPKSHTIQRAETLSRPDDKSLTVPCVHEIPRIPKRLLRYRPTRWRRRTGVPVRSTPPCTFCPHSDCDYRGWLGLGQSSGQRPSQWRPLASVPLYVVQRLLFGDPRHPLPRQTGSGGADRARAWRAWPKGWVSAPRPGSSRSTANTVLQWLVEAAEQLRAFSASFLCDLHLEQLQLDELYAVLRDAQSRRDQRQTRR